MKKILAMIIIGLLCLSTFSVFAPRVKAGPDETPVEVAQKAATWIMSQAVPEAGGYKWAFQSSHYLFYESNVQWGSAGFGKFFLALYEATGNSLYLDYAKGAANWVISKAIPDSGGYKWAHPDDDIPSPGWWLSPTVSGIAEFLLRMHQTTGDSIYLDYAKGAARWLMAMAYWGEPGCFIPYNPPGRYGTQAAHGISPGREAYTVTFLLHLYQETGDTAYLPYVEGTATWLMSGPDKVAESGGYKWRHGRPYGSGYSIDGNGRIAAFFYEIYQALGKAEYLDYANKAMTWLLSQAVVAGDKAKWPDNQGSGSYPILPFAGSFFGGRGEEARVCDLLMVAYEVTSDTMYLEYAKKLANWVISPAVATPEGGGYKFPYYEGSSYYDVFHNARVYNFLSWMYGVTGETSYSEYADGALTWIIYKAESADGGYKWRTLDYSPYYATWFSGGAAGIGYYLASSVTTLPSKPTLGLNLIPNSGFEGGLAYWSISEGAAFYAYDDQQFHSGSRGALGLESQTGSLGRLYQDVTDKVMSGKKYKISGWIKTFNVEGSVVIALDYVASNGWTPADGYVKEIGYVAGTTDWTYFESNIFTLPPMPGDAEDAWFLFDFNAGKGIAWWDDVSLNEIEYVRPDDLSLVNLEPVQVVYGASALVTNKPTLLRADIRNSFENEITASIKITWDDISEIEQLLIPPLKTTTYHLPSNGIFKFETAGTHSVSATIDSDELLVESDETNNYQSLSVAVKNTKELKILYRGVNFPWESGQPDQSSIQRMNSESSRFINITYPISELSNTTGNSPYVISGLSLIPRLGVVFTLWDLTLQAVLTGNDVVVGDVRKDFFWDHTLWTGLSGGTVGLTIPSFTKAALVEQGYWTTTAHEVGHLNGLPLGVEEEYGQQPYPRDIGNWASGYSVVERELLETYCFMGSSASEMFDRWIENKDYEHLLTRFKEGPDPQILFVGGIVFNNGTVNLFPWYTMPYGTPDLSEENHGDYGLVFLDNQGDILGQIGFNITFTILGTVYDAMGFAFTVPYFPDTHQILLTHETATIGQRTVTGNPPTVAVTYPNGGEAMIRDRIYSLHWEAADADGDTLSYSVLFSPDRGSNWQPLATNLQEKTFDWEIPEGLQTQSGIIKVIASDGVNTGEDRSDDTFVIVEQPATKLEMTRLIKNELQYLIDEFDTIYADVKPGVRQGLLDKITSATTKVDQAIKWINSGGETQADNMLSATGNIMEAFIHLVVAQSDKGIPEYKAESLVFDSMAIVQDVRIAQQM